MVWSDAALTCDPLTWEWGWCSAGCYTWPHIHIAWRGQSCLPERVWYRKRSRWVDAACTVWGYMSTRAYCQPQRSVYVSLHTSRDSIPCEHQLKGHHKNKETQMINKSECARQIQVENFTEGLVLFAIPDFKSSAPQQCEESPGVPQFGMLLNQEEADCLQNIKGLINTDINKTSSTRT